MASAFLWPKIDVGGHGCERRGFDHRSFGIIAKHENNSPSDTTGFWHWTAFVGSSRPTLRYYNPNAGPARIGQASAGADTVGFLLWKETGASLPARAGTLRAVLSGDYLMRVRAP